MADSTQSIARRANLRSIGVGPNVLGLAVERSLEMVVGLLGILKAGGPMSPSIRLTRPAVSPTC